MINKIKSVGLIILISLFTSSCFTAKIELLEAGKLTLVSTKNVDFSKEQALLASSAGFDESQVEGLNNKKTRSKTKKRIVENYDKLKAGNVEQAINNVIESVPGGVYIENLELYYSGKFGTNNIYFIASGDVYGVSGKEQNIRGFYSGCLALYKKKRKGKILSLVDDQYCLWQEEGKKKPTKVLYDDLIKIGD